MTLPARICVAIFTARSVIEVIDYMCHFFTSLNFSFIFFVRSCTLFFPQNSLAEFNPECDNNVIRWIRISMIGIGVLNHKHPSWTKVSNCLITIRLMLERW